MLQGFDADDVAGDYNDDPDVENDVINETDMKVIRCSIPNNQCCQSLNTVFFRIEAAATIYLFQKVKHLIEGDFYLPYSL